MKCLYKAICVLLMVASSEEDHLDSEELQAQLDMCDGFLTTEEVIFFTENSQRGQYSEVSTWENAIWNRFSHYLK